MEEVVCLQQKFENGGWGLSDRQNKTQAFTTEITKDTKGTALPRQTGVGWLKPTISAHPNPPYCACAGITWS
jgi:hypothetical protein